jgi:multicomponent Na+:H+ antiporter subunit G
MSEVLSAGLLIIGAAFMLLASVGIVRMPDLFTRMQASTKASTLGAACMLAALAIFFGQPAITARAILIICFIFLTASVAAHLIARAAYAIGVPLWEGTLTDELREEKAAEISGSVSPLPESGKRRQEQEPHREEDMGEENERDSREK